MRFSVLCHYYLGAAGLALASAEYRLDALYDDRNFFDHFEFFSEPDPTHGHVQYVDRATALQMGLAGHIDDKVYMGVDSAEISPVNGRKSVRLTSNRRYNHGLFLGDFSHMPANTCGVWPAFWMFGPEWPWSGEIDILEGVNDQDSATITLHTGHVCSIQNDGSQPQTFLKGSDCSAGQGTIGCGQQTHNADNYGTGLNAIGGGVYALEWTSHHIAIWFFPRYAIPVDIVSEAPNPSSWGLPAARFVGGSGCDLDQSFKNNNIVFSTTFCGDWAGSTEMWNKNSVCSALAPTCVDYVNSNPSVFEEAYWLINSIKVYQMSS